MMKLHLLWTLYKQEIGNYLGQKVRCKINCNIFNIYLLAIILLIAFTITCYN